MKADFFPTLPRESRSRASLICCTSSAWETPLSCFGSEGVRAKVGYDHAGGPASLGLVSGEHDSGRWETSHVPDPGREMSDPMPPSTLTWSEQDACSSSVTLPSSLSASFLICASLHSGSLLLLLQSFSASDASLPAMSPRPSILLPCDRDGGLIAPPTSVPAIRTWQKEQQFFKALIKA